MLYKMWSSPATHPFPSHPCSRVRGHSICIYVYLRYLEFVFVFWEACEGFNRRRSSSNGQELMPASG